MSNSEQQINCPHCAVAISIDHVLTRQIGDKIRREFEAQQKIKEQEIASQKAALELQRQQLEEAKQQAQIVINKKVQERLQAERQTLWQDARKEAEKLSAGKIELLSTELQNREQQLIAAQAESLQARSERQKLEAEKRNFELEKIQQLEQERSTIEAQAFSRATKQSAMEAARLQQRLAEIEHDKSVEQALLKEQLAEKETRLRAAAEQELILRKEKIQLEEAKRSFELEKQRQLDEERSKIWEESSRNATEKQQHIIDQLHKQLNDATKAKDELARKLEQGSQQLQGEVLELALEDILKAEFPHDEITPVSKGVYGADVVQRVCDRAGRVCGQIVWEAKRTKSWQAAWIPKLKQDQRAIKADFAVLVSAVLPDDVHGFAFREGVWICDIKLISALAIVLRINLEAVSREKALSIGKQEKMELLYGYLTGIEFRQRVEAIVEAFTSMEAGLRKERIAYEKIWAEREKQIKKMMQNTIGMYGDLNGLVTLPQIRHLELDADL